MLKYYINMPEYVLLLELYPVNNEHKVEFPVA